MFLHAGVSLEGFCAGIDHAETLRAIGSAVAVGGEGVAGEDAVLQNDILDRGVPHHLKIFVVPKYGLLDKKVIAGLRAPPDRRISMSEVCAVVIGKAVDVGDSFGDRFLVTFANK